MFKASGKHRAPRRRRVMLPLWAGALLVTLSAMHEMNAATAAQLAEYAQGGTL